MLTASSIRSMPGQKPWVIDPMRVLIGVYFWLILGEGVLRKWILPEYSELLFIARDPVVILIYLTAFWRGIFPARLAVVILGAIAGCSLLLFSFTEAPLIVGLFGLRTNYLHPPLVFIMGMVLEREDVVRYGKWILGSSIPIVLLMLFQFQSAPDALANAGVGGTTSSQLTGAMGKVRPSGPFSFTTGMTFFLGLTAAVLCHGWYQPGTYPRWLLIAGTLALVIAIPLSISRAALLSVLVVVGFAGLAILDPRNWNRVIVLALPAALVAFFAYTLRDSEYFTVFNARWVDANNFRGGGFMENIVIRVLDDYLAPFRLIYEVPWHGYGNGMGTSAGARLIEGARGFLLAEGELARVVFELGPALGFAFIAWRVWLALSLLRHGWFSFRNDGNLLAWAMAGAGFVGIVSAQWGQATMLGFSVFTAGLSAAALNRTRAEDSAPPDPVTQGEN